MSLKGPSTSQGTDRSPSSLGRVVDVWMVLLILSCFFLYIFSFSITFFFLCFSLPASLPFILSQVLSPPSFSLPSHPCRSLSSDSYSFSSISLSSTFLSSGFFFPLLPLPTNFQQFNSYYDFQIFLSCRLCQGLWWSVRNPEGPSG